MRRLGELARTTPENRERLVDLLRAVAIIAVVLGHWTVTVIERGPDGHLTGHSALPDLPWAHPVTWLAQVIPIFFLVGGYANAASLRSRYRRGGTATDWLRERSGRLIRPTTVLLLVLTTAALAGRLLGAPAPEIRMAVWFATIPLWFLATYLAVVGLTPVMYALHRRFGLIVPLVLVGLVAAGDLIRLHGPAVLATGNFLFGWLAVHQVGFAWHDRSAGRPDPGGIRATRLPARPGIALALLFGGLATLLSLTVLGPYPVSMINLPGERLQNMSPPSLALLALATAQLGLIMLLRGPAERWLHRPRPWLLVVAINAVVLTIFLWHVPAAILGAGALDRVGPLPAPPVDTTDWFLWRVPWLILLTLMLAGLVAIFGRFEWRGDRRGARGGNRWIRRWPKGLTGRLSRYPAGTVLTVTGYLAVSYGLLDNSMAPRDAPEPLGIPTTALAAYFAGAAVLRVLRRLPDPPPGAERHGAPAANPAGSHPATDGHNRT